MAGPMWRDPLGAVVLALLDRPSSVINPLHRRCRLQVTVASLDW
jgi:hypothetical protein